MEHDLLQAKFLELSQLAAGSALMSLFQRAGFTDAESLALLRMEIRLFEWLSEHQDKDINATRAKMMEFLREENMLASACKH